MEHTFLWHDYETFGINPRSERPSQFAAIRTDAQLNPIGAPINLLCQPAPDYLPQVESCLITGITPQQCHAEGLPEHEFAARIQAEFSRPGTIGVGYNSIRFDDEFTRFLLWRNLHDPYAREWQNGCSRWDLLDVVRLCHALRPDGIQWPTNPDTGNTSFRLELLSQANGLMHEQAHDALSDVQATIALARLIRQAQPKLWDFALALRDKKRVGQILGLPCTPDQAKPFLHVSGQISGDYGHLALMWPLAQHPSNRNEVICWDLRHDPRELLQLDADSIRLRLFSKQSDLPAGSTRLPIKNIHLNKSPMVVAQLATLSPTQAERWRIDPALSLQHAEYARALPDMSAIWQAVFQRPSDTTTPDVDGDLYGGFLSDADRNQIERLRQLDAQAIHHAKTHFADPRLDELFWRYRARNFAATMPPAEQHRWFQHCLTRLQNGSPSGYNKAALQAEVADWQDRPVMADNEHQQSILEDLYSYADELEYSLEHWLEQLAGLL